MNEHVNVRTGEVVTVNPMNDLEARKGYAQVLAGSKNVPAAFQGKPADIFFAVEMADALGIARVNALTEIHMVQGRPTISANLMGALTRKAGHALRIQTDTENLRVRVEIVRHDDKENPFVTIWDMKRAQTAGITGKDTWKKFPLQMLKARAISECVREACAEVLVGTYAPEEFNVETVELGTVSVAPQHQQETQHSSGLAALRQQMAQQPAPPEAPEPLAMPEEIIDGELLEDFTEYLGNEH